jgi:hypothetical protein
MFAPQSYCKGGAVQAIPSIAAFDYLNRYTNAEIDALNTAALVSPPTAANLALFKFLTQTAAQGSVGLARPRLATAHALLVARGLLTAARSAVILTP